MSLCYHRHAGKQRRTLRGWGMDVFCLFTPSYEMKRNLYMAQQVAIQTLPPEVYQLAAYYQLGAPAAEYRRWLRPAWIVLGAFLALVGLVFFYLALVSAAATVLPFLIIGLA